jgi:hypothetical protein
MPLGADQRQFEVELLVAEVKCAKKQKKDWGRR